MDRHGGRIDRPVFAIAAGISLAIIVLGMVLPRPNRQHRRGGAQLADREPSAGCSCSPRPPSWCSHCARRSAATAAAARHRRRRPEFSTLVVGRDDVQRRDGHRADVLRRRRAGLPPRRPAPGTEPRRQPDAARPAMAYTFFHWALHPWAMYAVVGLALAYFTFRMGRGNLMSSPFQAIFGKDRIEQGWGKVIDIIAIITTKFGSATSLGLGALQIAAGIELSDREVPSTTGRGPADHRDPPPLRHRAVRVPAVSPAGSSGVTNTNMVVAFALVVFVFRRPARLHLGDARRPRPAPT